MKFFKQYFGDKMNELTNGELAVCCPFPHTDPHTGEPYYEKNPSAHINPDEGVFHCKVCNKGYTETSFVASVEGISYTDAKRLLRKLGEEAPTDDWDLWEKKLKDTPERMKMIDDLGIESIREELRLGYQGSGIAFPVFVYGERLDVRTYNPGHNPKVVSEPNAEPLILPYDLWVNDDRPTLLCAGEKDMAIARVNGFNAITFTGGEGSFPKFFKYQFKNRKIYIAYDNDFAGCEGAVRVAMKLKEAGSDPYILDLSPVCTEKGEDIHDFFKKYNQTSHDLQRLMDKTPVYTEEEYNKERNKEYPLVRLQESLDGKYKRKLISSRVAVVAEFDRALEVPALVEFEKFRATENCILNVGEKREWYLDENNLGDILKLCDSNLKDHQVKENLKTLAGIPAKEKFVSVKIHSIQTIFKSVVTDDMESEMVQDMENYRPYELTVYALQKLHNGGKYRIFFKRYAHPLQGQEIVGVVARAEESDTSVNRFKVTEKTMNNLKLFQSDNVSEKMDELAERAKAFCGAETRKDLAWFVDLFYHTPLYFKFGERKERAYLDIMVVGESRTGKSQTAQKMLEQYELGVFTSLKTSTVAGLIGGSDQTSGGMKTKLGLIPRNHKGAVIMEEFSGGGQDIAKKLTEIRSSNKVRITRVNGTTTVDAVVRMLSISNQATGASGQSIPLRQYPNGIKVLLDLIGAAEDIARYDLFLLVDEPKTYTRPNTKLPKEALPKEAYLDRVRWVWSRTADQIAIDETTQDYILDTADKLNEEYNTHIKFFGSEAWKKLTRLAIACAGCVASSDDSFEKIVVKPEHVKWARDFMVSCYDNDLFNMKEHVKQTRRYSECDQIAIDRAQGFYNTHPTLCMQLDQSVEMTQMELRNISGLEQDKFAEVIRELTKLCFIHHNGGKIAPSERFRRAYRQAQNQYMKRLGES